MHKKTVTPIFVLKGTANMTMSAGLNEEDVDVMFGNPQYDMCSSCEDTISQANRIN